MDEVIYIPTIIIGAICVALYLYSCHANKQEINLSILVNTVLSASGIAGGGFLMLATVVPSLKSKLSSLNLYIFIAGLVVLVVSAQSIYREVRRKNVPQPGAPADRLAPASLRQDGG